MTQTARTIARAFVRGEAKTIKNTRTDGLYVWHHGNMIARRNADNSIDCTLAGWPTVTTRDRVNAIARECGAGVYVSQRNFEQNLHGPDHSVIIADMSSRNWFTVSTSPHDL